MAKPSSAGFLRRAWRKVDKFFSMELFPEPKVLYTFTKEQDTKAWHVFSDKAFGGLSEASFALSAETQQTAMFSGRYSKNVREDSALVRSGYVGVNQIRRRAMDLRPFDYLDFRVRGDGNTYLASMRLDQLTGGDDELYQTFLHTQAGKWQDVRLDFRDFSMTYKGHAIHQPVHAVLGIPRHNILAIGITMAASEEMPDEGDFKLEVESVIAGAYKLEGAAAGRKAYAGLYHFQAPDPELDAVPRIQPPAITTYTDPRPQDGWDE